MEIERKFLVKVLPDNLSAYPCRQIEQAYLCTAPVVRIRHLDDEYILTYKSGGMMARQEVELPLTKEAYLHLREKADGTIISKKRYVIPLTDSLMIELDIFEDMLAGFIMAEVEFPSIEEANSFLPPEWFGKDVTFFSDFHNSHLSSMNEKERELFLYKLKNNLY
ncbi:MAG: CYTH domain-containing protein [Lachnospiraceae bacterium]|nr:CYTH domain-containing protein [Lachnospiraceae bacterium]